MQVSPYLMFDGRCAEAFRFYETVLGGRIVAMMTYADAPGEAPPGMRDRIIHARLALDGQVLMGSDAPAERAEPASGFNVTLTIDDPADAERVFLALSDGGTVRMPLQETFWAQRFGMLADRFGTPWMINCEKPQA